MPGTGRRCGSGPGPPPFPGGTGNNTDPCMTPCSIVNMTAYVEAWGQYTYDGATGLITTNGFNTYQVATERYNCPPLGSIGSVGITRASGVSPWSLVAISGYSFETDTFRSDLNCPPEWKLGQPAIWTPMSPSGFFSPSLVALTAGVATPDMSIPATVNVNGIIGNTTSLYGNEVAFTSLPIWDGKLYQSGTFPTLWTAGAKVAVLLSNGKYLELDEGIISAGAVQTAGRLGFAMGLRGGVLGKYFGQPFFFMDNAKWSNTSEIGEYPIPPGTPAQNWYGSYFAVDWPTNYTNPFGTFPFELQVTP